MNRRKEKMALRLIVFVPHNPRSINPPRNPCTGN